MRGLGDAAEYVMTVVRSLEFDVSESSRLARMRDLFRRTRVVKETDPDFELACEALRDITLLEFAFDQLSEAIPRESLQNKVQLLVKDAPLPQDDCADTLGRNTQSELYVAAICNAAGLRPSLDEPDVVVETNGVPYGLAVKRLKSLRQLNKRFPQAVDQIERSGMPGFVVLDVVLALNPKNRKLWFVKSDDEFFRTHALHFQRLGKRWLDPFVSWRRGREVRGVIILDHVVRKLEDGGWGLGSFTLFMDLDPYNQRRRREAYRFWQIYEKGVPYPVSLP